MEAASTNAPPAAGPAGRRSALLLRLASDESLVRRLRQGSEPAFEVLYDRYHRQVLSFCRHMLGSPHDAEEAVQQTFINAYSHILRSQSELRFRPWIYRIARNLCVSALRARRGSVPLAGAEPSVVGLSEQVRDRGDLRDLLRDLAALPVEQREALVLAELHGSSHAEVAEIIRCDREKVKSLVFQARSSLIRSREAREIGCVEIRRQLSVLRGGSRRRSVLRRHLNECEGCRRFDRALKEQRRALGIVLPVLPSAALELGAANAAAAACAAKAAAGGAASLGGGLAAAGGGASGGAAGASGAVAALAGKLGLQASVVKGVAAAMAVVAATAGGTAGVKATEEGGRDGAPRKASPAVSEVSTTNKLNRILGGAGRRAAPVRGARGERALRPPGRGSGASSVKQGNRGRWRGSRHAEKPRPGRERAPRGWRGANRPKVKGPQTGSSGGRQGVRPVPRRNDPAHGNRRPVRSPGSERTRPRSPRVPESPSPVPLPLPEPVAPVQGSPQTRR